MKKPYAIIIMDGYGSSCEEKGNAIKCAHSTNVDALMAKYPSTLISLGAANKVAFSPVLSVSSPAHAEKTNANAQKHNIIDNIFTNFFICTLLLLYNIS